ncbi:rubredoxin [Abyssibacter profundi]|uniref:rubredoxin n=1 Tax=Abyssibacter profundi TaxID=2182787 RepID=UPI0034DD5405
MRIGQCFLKIRGRLERPLFYVAASKSSGHGLPVGHARSAKVAKYQCDNCDYVYDEAEGAPKEGFPAGTPWATVPDDWPCPDCAVREKIDFERVESE